MPHGAGGWWEPAAHGGRCSPWAPQPRLPGSPAAAQGRGAVAGLSLWLSREAHKPSVTSPFGPSMGVRCTQLLVHGQLAPEGSAGGRQEGWPRSRGLRQPQGAQGSRSNTAGRGSRTRTRVRASCPCCSLLAGLRFFLGSQAEVVAVPRGFPGPGHAAAATSPPEQQVATRSVPLPAGSKAEGGQRGSWFWAMPWQGSGLATQALPAGTGDARADRQEPTAPYFPWRVLPGSFCSAA